MASKRNKKKAKRFGAGSAKPIVDASTYGAGNAFSSAGAESLGGAGGAANGTGKLRDDVTMLVAKVEERA